VLGVFGGGGEAHRRLRLIERRPVGNGHHHMARSLAAARQLIRPRAGLGLDQFEADAVGVAHRLPVRVIAPVRGAPGAIGQAPVVHSEKTRVLGSRGAAIARQHTDPGNGSDG
jgi:hypothetical protein